jgi:hypothetical protein
MQAAAGQPPPQSERAGSLAGEPATAHTHVRDEQYDEHDCEDDVDHHFTSNSEPDKRFLPSIIGFPRNVPPFRGVRDRRWAETRTC